MAALVVTAFILALRLEEGAGAPKFAYPGRKIAIFVHGCFWAPPRGLQIREHAGEKQ